MRKLIIFRGPPGSGKSHTIQELGLTHHTLSMDAIRRVVGGVDMSPDGNWGITQAHNQRVAAEFSKLANERMERGETLALEAVFAHHGDMEKFIEMARHHRYQVAIMDFSTVPEEKARAQNAQRDSVVRLNDQAMDRWINAFKQQGPVKPDVADHVVQWSPNNEHLQSLRNFLAPKALDVSSFKKVVFIGDLQGCATPLTGPGGLMERGFEENTLYVFLGDFLDRGPQNGEVMRWLVDHALPRHGQVLFVWGNHEDHLHRWARGLPPVSAEFSERTLPQLLAAGLTPADAEALCAKIDEMLVLKFHGQNILVTHAGLPTLPARLEMVSTYQLTHGTGSWSDPVDHQFARLAPEGWMQVHGHRNHGRQDTIATPQSINLEDSVERGGCLRAVILDQNGWTPVEIPNEDFLDIRQQRPKKKPDWAPQWLSQPRNTQLPPEMMEAMRAHEGVHENVSKSMPEIASFNFTRDVFFKKSWDDLSIKARGLFFHRQTGEIVARGYEKFFNLNERPETQMDALEKNLVFPVQVYVKENGYLGNLGLHPQTKQLFYASKSTPDGEFASWFREIMESTTTPNQRERIRRFLRDFEGSMVFEVIDPLRDPHLVEYDRPQVILLDVFHRSTSGDKIPYEQLKRIGHELGLTVKERAMKFSNFEQMQGFLANKEGDLTWRYKQRDIEGFVFEDVKGFQTKDKVAHYSFWKDMRGVKDRLCRLRTQKEELLAKEPSKRNEVALHDINNKINAVGLRKPHPLSHHFIEWMNRQPVEHLQRDILSLRRQYLAQENPDPALFNVPWQPYGPQPGAPRPSKRP